jgi:hypothetical protein
MSAFPPDESRAPPARRAASSGAEPWLLARNAVPPMRLCGDQGIAGLDEPLDGADESSALG